MLLAEMVLRSRIAAALRHFTDFASPTTTTRPQQHEMVAGSRSPTSSSSPSPPWVILGTIPRVASSAGSDLPRGADASLAVAAPPRVTLLTIARRLFPDGVVTPGSFPSIAAVEPSAGLLLLHADQGRATGPTIVDRPGAQSFTWRDTIPGYFVLELSAASASAVSVAARTLPEPELIMHPGNLGILASPAGDGHYVVAELQPIVGTDEARLLCFSSRAGDWVFRDVRYPAPPRYPMAPNGVVSHAGRLWWVDLSVGLVAGDPFAGAPVLAFVPLPPGAPIKAGEAWGVLDRHRAVGVSAGRLRFVDMYKNRDRRDGKLKVSLWTLRGDGSDDTAAAKWTLEYEACFADIWAHPSYQAAGLPRKIPVLALVHPELPYVVYFFVEAHLVGVDLRDGAVVECAEYQLVAPPREHVASRFVHAFPLPSSSA